VRFGVGYLRQTEAEYQAQHREKQEKALHRRARELGYKLEKIEPPLPAVNMPEGEVMTSASAGAIENA
jgi:hypothetical protein